MLATRGPREDEEGIIPLAMQADPLRTQINRPEKGCKQATAKLPQEEGMQRTWLHRGHVFFSRLIAHTHWIFQVPGFWTEILPTVFLPEAKANNPNRP